MSNQAILKLVGQSDLSPIARDLRNITTEGKSAGPALQSLSQQVKSAETQSVSFGSKLKSLGSSFGSTVANVSTLGLSMVNLQRGYRDLGDAQIAVDRSNQIGRASCRERV